MLRALDEAALVVDATFGFGFTGTVREPYARAIEALNDCDAAVLSVDVPSGIDSDTGAVGGTAVRADVTLTFSAPKLGLVHYPGAEYAGEVRAADIGLPRHLVDEVGELELLDAEDLLELFPFPRPDDHKGSRGRVLVVAGSPGMTGAATLASSAALRMGAGYVKLACPASLLPTLAAKLTPVVLSPLPESEPGVLAAEAAAEVLRLAEGYDAVVLGPGITAAPGPADAAERLARELRLPLVADADALNALAARGLAGLLSQRGAPTILTPHPGEAARLLGESTGEVQADRVAAAQRLAGDAATCVLKGARSVIAGEGRCAVNASGNAGMATAGTGDVLAGVLGTLLAQGLTPFEAAALGTYLHGRAGDHAASALTETCVTAEDVLAALPEAVAELLGW
jgi:NAD(P)H-hydrate epimerase